MPFQGDAPEGTHSDGTYEEKSRRLTWLTKWDKEKNPMIHSYTDAPEESDLWTAWQLYPLDDDQTCHSKDWVGDWVDVELIYNSVKTRSQRVGVIDEMW